MRVAIIEPVGGRGGMDYYDFGLCEGLSRAGVRAALYTCDETALSSRLPFDVSLTYRQIYGDDPAWRRGVRYLWGSIRAILHSRLSGSKLCHFHLFHAGPLEVFNICLAKFLLMRVIVTAHDVVTLAPHRFTALFFRLPYLLADRLIVHNKASLAEMEILLGNSSKRIDVVPHGNYLHSINAIPEKSVARERLALPQNKKVLLFFGQIKEAKGLDILLDALPSVIEKHPDIVLLVAGKVWKDDFSRYQKMIEEQELSSHCITRIGYVPNEEVPAHYASADLVVLPYRRIYQSGVILMAMSHGKPVLASDLPGMSEVITDGVTGFLFKSEDSEALARRIIEIFSNPDGLPEVATSGHKKMEKDYCWERIGELTAECYRAALG